MKDNKHMSYTYRNVSGMTQTLMGYGSVEADTVIQTENIIENPNFELVSGAQPQTIDGIAPPQPNIAPLPTTQTESEVQQ